METEIYTWDDIVFTIDSSFFPDRIHLLEEKFDSIVNYQEKNVTLDMVNIVHLDSLLLSILIRFRSRLSIFGRTLRLVNCNEAVINSIRLAALEDYFLD